MPRGFLVKRLQKHPHPPPYRVRRYSDEDRSDSSSDHDGGAAAEDGRQGALGTPDSGFGSPPGALLAPYRNPELRLYYPAAAAPPPLRVSDAADAPLALTTRRDGTPPPFGGATNLSLPRMDRLSVSQAAALRTPPHGLAASAEPTPPPKKRLLTGGEAAPEFGGRTKSPKKPKAVRRLNFDEDKSSPVSGTIIRELDSDEEPLVVRKGDIDPSYNVVEVTDEAKAEIAKIENRIGDYVCRLCKEVYDDAFGLAQHRCSRIVHVEYRCPECDKVFNCPANLASHRRWHKPRPPTAASAAAAAAAAAAKSRQELAVADFSSDNDSSQRGTPSPGVAREDDVQYECHLCPRRFRRRAYLRKHMAGHADGGATGELLRLLSTINGRVPAAPPSVGSPPSSRSTSPEEPFGVFRRASPADFNGNRDAVLQVTLGGGGGGQNGNAEAYACKYCPGTFGGALGLARHVAAYHPTDNRQVLMLHSPTVKASH